MFISAALGDGISIHVVSVVLVVLWFFGGGFPLLVPTPMIVRGQLLSPISLVAPLGTSWIEQMTYYPANDTLYYANKRSNVVGFFPSMSTQPVTPATQAPWGLFVLAGTATGGGPSPDEQFPSTAGFFVPIGIVGWPLYAVSPTAVQIDPSTTPWAGLFVTDSWHTIRFINFVRGNNVTLVAGSLLGESQLIDGVGPAAQLQYPYHMAQGRFLSVTVNETVDPRSHLSGPPHWTTVILWVEYGHCCVRQGLPLDATTLLPINSTSSLQTMQLNVSTFAGLCGASGANVGPVFNVAAFSLPKRYRLGESLCCDDDRDVDSETAQLHIGDLRWRFR